MLIELNTSNGCILLHVNYISMKSTFKKRWGTCEPDSRALQSLLSECLIIHMSAQTLYRIHLQVLPPLPNPVVPSSTNTWAAFFMLGAEVTEQSVW